MFKHVFIFLLFIVSNHNGVSQNVFSNFVDGKIWFQIQDEYRHEEYIVKTFQEDVRDIPISSLSITQELSNRYNLSRLSRPFSKAEGSDDLIYTFLLEFTDIYKIDQIIKEFSQCNYIKYAEKVPLSKTEETPDDTYFNNCWSIDKIQAELAWDITKGDSNIVVASVDDAMDLDHDDLLNILLKITII